MPSFFLFYFVPAFHAPNYFGRKLVFRGLAAISPVRRFRGAKTSRIYKASEAGRRAKIKDL